MVDKKSLEQIAIQLIGRVRDELPDSVLEWLMRMVPDPQDTTKLCITLASAVPDDQTWSELTAWLVERDRGPRRGRISDYRARYGSVKALEGRIRHLAEDENMNDCQIGELIGCSRSAVRYTRQTANPPIPYGRKRRGRRSP